MHVPVGARSAQHFARGLFPRQPDASPAPASSTPVPSVGPAPIRLSTSAKSLIGAFTVIGAIIFGVIAWKVHSIYKRKRNTRLVRARLSGVQRSLSEKKAYPIPLTLTDSNDVDEPRKVVLLPPIPSSPGVGWTPQIRNVTLPSGVAVPPVAVTAPSRSPAIREGLPPTPNSGPSIPEFPSPPPSYRILALNTVPPPPPPPETTLPEIPPPTPMTMNKKFSVDVTAPMRESFDLPPVPSPRSASFNRASHTTISAPRTSINAVFSQKSLPRLMLVTAPFKPTRDDELAVRPGETLRMLDEFEDEWCLVQRVGRSDAEKGVIPRFCLVDRPRIIEKSRVTLSNFPFGSARRK
ncbi:hypothetical protein BC834DRAFT_966019 [Gloeopeniophorella convolvens]|nr:hypothetical protein BC834DRAFT_966019 [Gloeopeniophorella convolvens]